ncbi:MAG: LytTR family DNA-binding domain-containing protein [Pseudomonadota bacterium]
MANIVNDTACEGLAHEVRVAIGQKQLWVSVAAAGAVIGLTGPFGTFEALPLAVRLGYWLAVVTVTFWIGFVVIVGTALWAEARGSRPWVALTLGALLASFPLTAWIAGLHALLFAQGFWADAVRLWPYVVVITPAVAVLTETLSSASAPEEYRDDTNGWFDQLPRHLGRDLVLLRAEDHYLRVETSRGDAMIRGRLQDATDALSGHGLRIHRSWWVARDAIAHLRSDNGAPVVVLRDGRTLPVGRTYRKAVRAAVARR